MLLLQLKPLSNAYKVTGCPDFSTKRFKNFCGIMTFPLGLDHQNLHLYGLAHGRLQVWMPPSFIEDTLFGARFLHHPVDNQTVDAFVSLLDLVYSFQVVTSTTQQQTSVYNAKATQGN